MRPQLYHHHHSRDSCGFGMVVDMHNRPSHGLVLNAVEALIRLSHRGGVGVDGTSDGCGLLVQKPDAFLRKYARNELKIDLPENYAVAVVFLSKTESRAKKARATLERELKREGLAPLGWRSVPLDESVCPDLARKHRPDIAQLFIDASGQSGGALGASLYSARRRAENALSADEDFYICSLSDKVLCYKGLVSPEHITTFFPDFADRDFASAICVFHVRYSTNTLPRWSLAQPFRMLAHNGEINTIMGNRNWSMARTPSFKSKLLPNIEELAPLVNMEGSDSSSLDNMLDFLIAGGLDPVHALRVLIPPAFENHPLMSAEARAFYAYHARHMEPWDGPAGIVTTDGRYAMCILDRNGLRPARYGWSEDGMLMASSETGVWDCANEHIIGKGRMSPGDILVVDTHSGEFYTSNDIEKRLSTKNPYKDWLKKSTIDFPARADAHAEVKDPKGKAVDDDRLTRMRKLFQCTLDECQYVLTPLVQDAKEATGSMGDDTPIAVMSTRIRPLYDFFRQQFAQVTNPAIDSLRESSVMSLSTYLGRESNIFAGVEGLSVPLRSPILLPAEFAALSKLPAKLAPHTLDGSYDPQKSTLKQAIDALTKEAEKKVRAGTTMFVVSDMKTLESPTLLPIPSIIAVAALHQHLILKGLRTRANLVVASGSARDSHQLATLFGFGATAVYPWLAYRMSDLLRTDSGKEVFSAQQAQQNYRKGIEQGILKIMSKMGIATLGSYRGAALFELLGFDKEVVSTCFAGAESRIGGMGFADIEADLKTLARRAIDRNQAVLPEGVLKFIHDGERHAYGPSVVHAIHSAVRTGEQEHYQRYADEIDNREELALRDMLEVLPVKSGPIDLKKVEPRSAIMPRFDSAGMSLGALSPEAHETLAVAMNRIGGRSNSGEGGEDPARYEDERCSKIKQVASGRFGVTPHYLSTAEVIQIKIAQGAKPGEGGQLPGTKVNSLIARLRFSVPGVTLISPPPHHDIYSIEDLAQLIYDLKEVNSRALVSVKLVAEPGIGTIAAGVAKAGADLITVSGHDGGTGASPLSSIRYAGSPWELGLSEVHQALRANGLRGTVRVQVDGGLKTGLDVIKGALLGAESFGFGSAPMIAMGCKYLRVCHLNNCATGVTTQDDVLRKKHFVGQVEEVVRFFNFVAEDVRGHLARLGASQLSDLIGAIEHLKPKSYKKDDTTRYASIDLDAVLSRGPASDKEPHYCVVKRKTARGVRTLSNQLLADVTPLIEKAKGASLRYEISNQDRTIGTALSGLASEHYGAAGMQANPINLEFHGTAGQSFGAWNAAGFNLNLIGDANDYVGKGLAGGRIVVRPPVKARYQSWQTPIAGNTCLYGATGGTCYVSGIVGERFAVRNSGAHAVVEGAGDHCCEYMTGGFVAALGGCGINFGAGMTGGLAFVYDEQGDFAKRYNPELVDIHRLTGGKYSDFADFLRIAIEGFVEHTQSERGKSLLQNFAGELKRFYMVAPKVKHPQLLEILYREQKRHTGGADLIGTSVAASA